LVNPAIHFILYNAPYRVYYCFMDGLRFQTGDIIKLSDGLATVLNSGWITVCDGWHPDKRRIHEEISVMTESGSILRILAEDTGGLLIRGE